MKVTSVLIMAVLMAILMATYVTASQDPFDIMADVLAESMTMKRRRGGKRRGGKRRGGRQPQPQPETPVVAQPEQPAQPEPAQEQPQEESDALVEAIAEALRRRGGKRRGGRRGRQQQPEVPVVAQPEPAQEQPQEEADSFASCSQQYPLFKQCGQSWSNQLISTDTICKSGCLMTSMCMALNGRGKTSMNPGQFATWLKSNGGFSGNLFVWGSVSKFGLTYEGKIKGTSAISQQLCAGKIVILNVRYGGHWVLATGFDGSSFTVNDPGYSKTSYTGSEVTQAAIYH